MLHTIAHKYDAHAMFKQKTVQCNTKGVNIGSLRGLTICTDAGQVVMSGVGDVFLEAEHRECMFHLVSNFKKKNSWQHFL